MSHRSILNQSASVLVIVDFQEAFRNAISDFSILASRIATAVSGAKMLGVPVLVTEQYPKGLGPTCEEISMSLSNDSAIVEKSTFSAVGAVDFNVKIESLNAKQILLCGLETHICVSQTAHDLIDHGFQVHLLADCVGSRFDSDRHTGMMKMQQSGVIQSSVEMMLFELMADSRHEKFRDIQALIL